MAFPRKLLLLVDSRCPHSPPSRASPRKVPSAVVRHLNETTVEEALHSVAIAAILPHSGTTVEDLHRNADITGTNPLLSSNAMATAYLPNRVSVVALLRNALVLNPRNVAAAVVESLLSVSTVESRLPNVTTTEVPCPFPRATAVVRPLNERIA